MEPIRVDDNRCLQAYLEFRKAKKPLVANKISKVSDQYVIFKVLRAKGQFFEIRQCLDKFTNEYCAAKIYRKAELTPLVLDLIRKEIKLVRRLDHPCLYRINHLVEDEDRIFVIMDDLSGSDLFSHIIYYMALTEAQCGIIAAQILSLVTYLHKHECVVRHMHPELLIFTQPENMNDLRLVDLMFFNYLDELEDEDPLFFSKVFLPPSTFYQGSEKFVPECDWAFSAPEMLPRMDYLKRNRKKGRLYDQKVDVWTVGCLIYNMLTGVPPFYEDKKTDMLEVIREGDWVKRSKLSTYKPTMHAIDLFNKIFVLDPNERLDSASLVSHPFF